MPKNIGYKPSTSKVGSRMSDPRPPKPAKQGDAKSSGPGSGAMRPAIKSGNSHTKPGMGGLRTNSMKSPGAGTPGRGTTHTPISRR